MGSRAICVGMILAVSGCQCGPPAPAVCAPSQQNQRISQQTCPSTRAASRTDAGAPLADAGCNVDSDCSAGKNGRCFIGNGLTSVARLQCSYDECLTDDDCGAGKVCQCQNRGPPEQGFTGHVCVVAGCKTNGDCGGACCAFSNGFCGSGVQSGYFCRTARDECVTDGDCVAAGQQSPNDGFCAWSPASMRWVCSKGFCQP